MVVGKLTLAQKNKLFEKEFLPDMVYNPFQDIDDNWCISVEEIEQSTRTWIKNLPLIEYVPKITESIFNIKN